MINDAHCHFFTEGFFAALAWQRGRAESIEDLTRELGWETPGSSEQLADRWDVTSTPVGKTVWFERRLAPLTRG